MKVTENTPYTVVIDGLSKYIAERAHNLGYVHIVRKKSVLPMNTFWGKFLTTPLCVTENILVSGRTLIAYFEDGDVPAKMNHVKIGYHNGKQIGSYKHKDSLFLYIEYDDI